MALTPPPPHSHTHTNIEKVKKTNIEGIHVCYHPDGSDIFSTGTGKHLNSEASVIGSNNSLLNLVVHVLFRQGFHCKVFSYMYKVIYSEVINGNVVILKPEKQYDLKKKKKRATTYKKGAKSICRQQSFRWNCTNGQAIDRPKRNLGQRPWGHGPVSGWECLFVFSKLTCTLGPHIFYLLRQRNWETRLNLIIKSFICIFFFKYFG